MDTKAFTSFLHSNIPLTEFMDIQAETYTPEKVVLSVPFAQNKNDKNTGFAGSISALMTVCGWSVMYANLHELLPKGNIVAQKTQLRYIAPIKGDFRAECICNDPEGKQALLDSFAKFQKGKLVLHIQCFCGDLLAAEMEATYFITK